MKTDLPQWVVQTAEKWGLLWGGYGWSGGCASPSASKSSILRDPMHFEFRGTPEQAVAIARYNGVDVPDAAAEPDQRTSRIFGEDRFASAAATSGFWKSAETVLIANGNSFPDSLAAGVTAASLDVPLLLVTGTSVPEATKTQLLRLRPKNLIVAGGPAAVTDEVLSSLRKITKVTPVRVAGDDRYVTAELLTRITWNASQSSAVWVASGRDFQDPLIASAAAAQYSEPFILIDGQGSLTPGQRDLLSTLGVSQINVVAAPGSMRKALVRELSALGDVDVFDAGDVSERSAEVWDEVDESDIVALATSNNFPDALSAVPYTTRAGGAPLLLVPGTCVPGAVLDAIDRLGPQSVTLFGGPAALAPPVEALTEC